jgi:multiple sugar transport system permease protein
MTTALTAAGRTAAPSRTVRRRPVALIFLTPWLIGMAIFFVYPLAATLYYSVTRFDLLNPPHFVGLRNYRFLLHGDPHVWQATRNTLWLVAVVVPLRVLFGLGCAGLVASVKRGQSLVRAACYLPVLAPPVAATVAFVFLFNPGTGPVNGVLRVLGVHGPGWFTDPAWAKPSLAFLAMWAVGDVMVLLLAALLDVPKHLYEAAAIDGAGPIRRWWHITLPTISPVLLFTVITGIIQTLQYFTQAAVAAQVASGTGATSSGLAETFGWPDDSTLTFPEHLYVMGFRYSYLGYASALAVVLFAVSLVFTVLLLRRFGSLLGDRDDA